VIIAANGVRLLRMAFDDVMDAAPPADVEAAVRSVALAVPGVRGTHKCRVRRSGVALIIDLDVIVDGAMTVRRGHEIAHDVKGALLQSPLGVLDVIVHVEPSAGSPADR
jgi:divalent metal cation (Fe/Co/Zn/Cd) transporter